MKISSIKFVRGHCHRYNQECLVSTDTLLSNIAHFHSIFSYKVLMYLVIWSSVSRALNLVFSSKMSSFTVFNIELNLSFLSRTNLAKLSFDTFDNDFSGLVVLINFKLKEFQKQSYNNDNTLPQTKSTAVHYEWYGKNSKAYKSRLRKTR